MCSPGPSTQPRSESRKPVECHGQLFSPRNPGGNHGIFALKMSHLMSPAVAHHKGLLGHAATILQSPGYAMKAIVDGIEKFDRSLGASLTHDEENIATLTKVLFRVNHPPSRPQVDDVEVRMTLLGSLKQLGSWEEQRAKTMKRANDGGWEIVCYLATNETFEYQYILKDFDGKPVWRSSAERQQTVQNIGGSNTLEIIDFITKGEEETGNLYNQAATGNRSECEDREENENDLAFNLPDCPAGVDIGRDSMCVLPRDSLLPPPTCENTKAMMHEGVGESVLAASALASMRERDSARGFMIGGAYFQDCQEEGEEEARLAVAARLKQERQEKQLQQGQVKHGGTPAEHKELERCAGDEEVERRLGEAALRISRMVELVCMPADAATAPPAEPLAAAALLSAKESATFENIRDGSLEDESEDVLSVAVGRLKEALEKQGQAYKAYEQAQHLQQLQQQQMQEQAEKDEERAGRIKELEEEVAGARLECTHLAAARLECTEEQEEHQAKEARTHQAALQAAQEECLLLQQKVADVTEEVEEERRLGKQLHSSLEEERELAKMRSRRLRSGIRSVQAQMTGVRTGFDGLRGEVEKIKSEMMGELCAMGGAVDKAVVAVAKGLQTEVDETRGKFEDEVKERRRLHNLVLELKGNIRVFARIRPISAHEKEAGKKSITLCPSETELSLCVGGKVSSFSFDRVFGQESTQEEVFSETAPLVVSVLDGYNVCIFAYGQTGSGKTHTMEGSEAMRGVNCRSLEALFSLAYERRHVAKYDFKVSLLEIYNEQIKDLIETHDGKGELKKLEVKNNPSGGTYVADLKTTSVQCMQDVLSVMSLGMRNRSTSSTLMNSTSSRSHCVLSVHTTCTDLLKGGTSFGKMHLVDLAGSERLSRTGAEGDRLTEAKNINKSLSALGNCIQALVSKAKFTPFRESKLTHFLQDSLGGDAKMLMFVCSSPCDADGQESKCSLEFATRVGTVELGTAKRRGDGGAGAVLKEMQSMLQSTKEEACKAGGEKEKLEEELARVLAEVVCMKQKALQAEGLVKQKEQQLQDKEKKLVAHHRENTQLLDTINRLQQQQQQHGTTSVGGGGEEHSWQGMAQDNDSRAGPAQDNDSRGGPVLDLGRRQSHVHCAALLTCRASCASSSLPVEPVAQNDQVSDEEEAQDNVDLEDNLNTYLLPADAQDEEDQEEDFEANDKENADSNEPNALSNTNHINTDAVRNMNVNGTGGTRKSCTATEQEEIVENGEGIDGAKSDWKQCKTDSKQSPTETIEERLERFRLKKEEAKKKMAAKEACTGSPKPTTKKASELVNPPPSSNATRQSIRPPFQAALQSTNTSSADLVHPPAGTCAGRLSVRPQIALLRPATAIPKGTTALSCGAARPKSAAVQPKTAAAGIADKPALRVRSDRSKPATGWR